MAIIKEENKEIRRPEEGTVYGAPRLRMAVPKQIPGYFVEWANDIGGGVDYKLSRGWEFVTPEEVGLQQRSPRKVVSEGDGSDRVSMVVGRANADDGTPLRAYLMKVALELWEKSEKARSKEEQARISGTRKQYEENASMRSYIPK